MTLASTAADVDVTSGAQAVQALTGATTVAFAQPGELVTIALHTTSGAFEWQIQPGPMSSDNFALSTGVLGEFFGKKFYSPSSSTTVSFTMPQVPCTFNFYSEVTDGNNVLRSLWTIQSRQAEADINLVYAVRYVVVANVVDLTAYTVADTEATGVQGDRVLLANQTTGAQGGIYEIGVVAAGTAPLTRVGDMAKGATMRGGSFTVRVSEGVTFANTEWFCANTGVVTIGTTSLAQAATTGFYPKSVVIRQALVAGTFTISTVPVRSLTRLGIAYARQIANTSTATTGGYHATTGGNQGVTVGKVGTAAIITEATVAAGTINNADISTLMMTITQQ